MLRISWQSEGEKFLISGDPRDVRVYRVSTSQEMTKDGAITEYVQYVPLFDFKYDPERNRARRTEDYAHLDGKTYERIFQMARDRLSQRVQGQIEEHRRVFLERQRAFAF